MRSLSYLKEGLLLAGRHKRMVLALWLVSLLPALALAAMIAAYLVPALGHSIFADRALTGDWFTVLRELRSPASDSLRPVIGVGALVMAGLTLLLQVAVSSGVVEVALERTPKSPFSLGIRKNFLRFLRTSLLVSPGLVAAAIAARLSMKGFGKLAESQSDGRFDMLGIAAAVLVFFLLWAPLDLAGDLSRIAAAHHDQRSMVFGFFRTLWRVLKRPGLLIPLYLVFLALALLIHFLYYQIRSPWSAATAATIVLSLLLQQAVMLLRAILKLGMWGAEVAVYRGFEEPQFCRPRRRRKRRTSTSPTPTGSMGSSPDPAGADDFVARVGADGVGGVSGDSRQRLLGGHPEEGAAHVEDEQDLSQSPTTGPV